MHSGPSALREPDGGWGVPALAPYHSDLHGKNNRHRSSPHISPHGKLRSRLRWPAERLTLSRLRVVVMRQLVCAALALVLPQAVALGQTATDNDLFAGYCVAVWQEDRSVMPGPPPNCSGLTGQQRQVCQANFDFMTSMDFEINRLRAYLAARGYPPGTGQTGDAMRGVALAHARGKADKQRCEADQRSCASGSRDLERLRVCAEQSDACRRVRRCYTGSPLPF